MNEAPRRDTPGEVTRLLQQVRATGDEPYEQLLPLVYGELRALASSLLDRERPNHTLNPTALVHEAYLKLVRIDRLEWEGRSHFLAIAATAMRRLLVDYGRQRRAQKRGEGRERVPFDDVILGHEENPVDLLALDHALEKLAELNARHARVVELRYFCGLGIEEVATVLEVSPRTVKNDWRTARLWLHRELEGES